MTPAERAREIDRREFEADCAAARQRAFSYVERCREEHRQRLARWLNRSIAASAPTRPGGRKAKLYTHDGASRSLSEWAIIAGVSYQTFAERIRSGMPFDKAVTMAPGERAALHTIDGVSKPLAQWAADVGITYAALVARMRKGRTLAEALAMQSKQRRGRGLDFQPSKGTGAGSTAQARPEIDFSQDAS